MSANSCSKSSSSLCNFCCASDRVETTGALKPGVCARIGVGGAGDDAAAATATPKELTIDGGGVWSRDCGGAGDSLPRSTFGPVGLRPMYLTCRRGAGEDARARPIPFMYNSLSFITVYGEGDLEALLALDSRCSGVTVADPFFLSPTGPSAVSGDEEIKRRIRWKSSDDDRL